MIMLKSTPTTKNNHSFLLFLQKGEHMLKKISYRELLELVHKGEQPKSITLSETTYLWDGVAGRYVKESDRHHSLLRSLYEMFHSEAASANAQYISYMCDPITEREKKYLSAVLAPFMDRIVSISKHVLEDNTQYIDIQLNNDSFYLPSFENGEHYKGMEESRAYTPKELGLREVSSSDKAWWEF